MEDYEIKMALLELKMYLELIGGITYSSSKLDDEKIESLKKNHAVLGLAIIKAREVVSDLICGAGMND